MITNESESLIRAAKEFSEVQIDNVGDGKHTRMVASVPNGRAMKSIKPFLDEYLTAPERKKGTAKLTALESFIAHVNRHKDADSVIFADDAAVPPTLTAVYDYNEKGDKGAPRFGGHRVQYTFPLSDEWKAWSAVADKPMTQEGFAEFVEARILDVLLPEKCGDSIKEFAVNLGGIGLAVPTQLMTLSRGLKVHVGATVANHVTLSSGEGQITFNEEHKNEDGGPIRVPGGFAIGIPVFRLGDVFQLAIRLRYRVAQGAISWVVSPYRTDLIFKTAFEEAVNAAQKETELPVFFGAPEA